MKKSVQKKIRLIFLSATWIRTWGPPKLKLHSKMPYTSRPRHRVLILAIILVYIVNTALQANIKRSGARKRKYLHANYWLEFVVLHVVYNISSRKCAEININEVTSSTKNFYLVNWKIRRQKKNFLTTQKNFLVGFFSLIPVKTFK